MPRMLQDVSVGLIALALAALPSPPTQAGPKNSRSRCCPPNPRPKWDGAGRPS